MNKLPKWIFICAILSGICLSPTGCMKIFGRGGDDGEKVDCPSAYRQPVKDYIALGENAFAAVGLDLRLKKKITIKVSDTQPSGLPLKMAADGNGCAYIPQVGKWAGATTTDKMTTTYYIYSGTAIPPDRMLHEGGRAIQFSEGIRDPATQDDNMKRAGIWRVIK